MRNQGIGDWIHRRRVKSAGHPAVVAGPVTRTYDELAERINRLAAVVTDAGIAAGDRVAYLGPNAPEFIETLFATTSLGAVFVPLNTRLAAPEIAYALADSGAALVVADLSLSPLLAGTAVPVVTLGDEYESALAAADPAHVDRTVALDDAALILYTSGTTGQPKGAVLSHGNLTWNAMNVLVDYDVTSAEVALMVSPLFHAASLGMGALPTLLKGGTLILQQRVEPGEVLAAIERHRVTSLSGVPTTYQMLVEHEAWASTDLSSITKLTCGGSPIPARVAEAFEARGLAFSSGYGMTEASPGATSLAPRHSRSHAATAGLPHFFTAVRIVGPDGDDVAPGEIGELLVAGPNVTSGYWARPDDTAGSFTDGWFRSGDLASRDADGFITIADRAKDMIISGGENIYPAEVEQAIMRMREVDAVAVIAVADDRWGEVGRALVVLHDGATVTHEQICAHLDGVLAKFKIPKSTVVVDELPRTASGKVRKAELRERYGA